MSRLTFCSYYVLFSYMDWEQAIEVNGKALAGIVAGLLELVGLQTGHRLPLTIYRLVARVLLPAESAVRRLIVIAARGMAAKPPSLRPMPKGLVIAGKGGARATFQLYDVRKQFGSFEDETARRVTGPRIRVVDVASPQAQFMAKFDVPGTCSASAASKLRSRLAAITSALDNLPRQARRLVQWRARRAALESPTFISPLRPGPPPGRRKRSRDQIDVILRECHALAIAALSPDTS